jgi:hypothetical protein
MPQVAVEPAQAVAVDQLLTRIRVVMVPLDKLFLGMETQHYL